VKQQEIRRVVDKRRKDESTRRRKDESTNRRGEYSEIEKSSGVERRGCQVSLTWLKSRASKESLHVLLVKPTDFVEGLVQSAGLVDVDTRDAMFVRSFASELGSVDVEGLALSRIRKTVGKEAAFDVNVV
jgi:hypothetical protein